MKDIWNVMDMFRLGLSFTVLINELLKEHDMTDIPDFVLPTMFLLCWIKVLLSYLAVFEATRYFVKMIIEIIMDIRSFLIILFISLIAFT